MKRARSVEPAYPPDQEAEAVTRPVSKYSQLDSAVADSENLRNNLSIMRCSLPPHPEPLDFNSFHEYESHYARHHSHRCADCHRNFPSGHLLDIHIEESHDSFVAVLRERGEKTYSCFVETCERKCSTPQKRRLHLIDKHLYPKNFFFAVTRDGIDGRRSLLNDGNFHHRRKSSDANTKASRRRSSVQSGISCPPSPSKSTATGDGVDTRDTTISLDEPRTPGSSAETPDTEMEDLATAMSSLKFLPRGVRFGKGRAGFARN